MPIRQHVETEVVCTVPHKLSLLASGSQETTAIHPKNGKVNYILSFPENTPFRLKMGYS